MPSEQSLYEDVVLLAEDIRRLDPWHRLPQQQSLALKGKGSKDSPIILSLQHQADKRMLFFHQNLNGFRAYIDALEEKGSAQLIATDDWNAIVLSFDDAQSIETEEERDHLPLTLQRFLPGEATNDRLSNEELRLLHGQLQILRKILISGESIRPVRREKHRALTMPAWTIESNEPKSQEPYYLDLYALPTPAPALIDEFTAARLKRLPTTIEDYELFFFYFKKDGDEWTPYPRIFFLVNLENGLIEWSQIIVGGERWHKKLLHRLYQYFFHKQERPLSLYIAHYGLYQLIYQDLSLGGLKVDLIYPSYIGDELMYEYGLLQTDN